MSSALTLKQLRQKQRLSFHWSDLVSQGQSLIMGKCHYFHLSYLNIGWIFCTEKVLYLNFCVCTATKSLPWDGSTYGVTGQDLAVSAPDHKQLAIYIFKCARSETEEKDQSDVYKWHGEMSVLNALPWSRGDLLFLYWFIFLTVWSRRKWLSTSVGGGLG